MKKEIKKWTLRFSVTGLLIATILLMIILNPVLTYANKTIWKQFFVYHSNAIHPSLFLRLEEASARVQKSECYTPELHLDICLNDGSLYPLLIKKIRGTAFAWGFYNKVVLQGVANYQGNYVSLNGYKWNLTQLLAHEMTHCFQYAKRGFWKSNPIAKIPAWKWEGYPEYVARKDSSQNNLSNNIHRLLKVDAINNNGWILFPDGTGTTIEYYKYWLLVQFSMDIKKMSYDRILNDRTQEKMIWVELMNWYHTQILK